MPRMEDEVRALWSGSMRNDGREHGVGHFEDDEAWVNVSPGDAVARIAAHVRAWS
jgi:hypothetical protein